MVAEYDGRFHLTEGCFSDMTALLQAQLTGFDVLDGAAFDLGQLANRGCAEPCGPEGIKSALIRLARHLLSQMKLQQGVLVG